MLQQNVAPGMQAEFPWDPKLNFGVVKKMDTGETFPNENVTQDSFCVDLMEYPSGVLITLTRNHSSGEYKFRAWDYPMPKTELTDQDGSAHFRHYYPN